MTDKAADLRLACKRVQQVADGKTINGTYRDFPMAALVKFRADLALLVTAASDRALLSKDN